MTTTENRPADDEAALKEFRGSESQVNSPSLGMHAEFSPTSLETLVERAAESYLLSIKQTPDVRIPEIRDALLKRINAEISLENKGRLNAGSASPQLPKAIVLNETTVVTVLLQRHHIVAVDLSEGHSDDLVTLAMYVDSGDDEGTYSISASRIKALAHALKPSMSAGALKSVYDSLAIHAPVRCRTLTDYLVPVGNGVFDREQQTLLPFSPEWVFLSKVPTNYDPTALNPIITMPDGKKWDVDTWMQELSDDTGVAAMLWEVVTATLLPSAPWGKSIWLMAESGNNGKGTLIQMLRNLHGRKACSSVKFSSFGREFLLEPLITARVNLVDENPVGAFAEDISDWKTAVTGDVMPINRKNKTPVAVRPAIFDIQCFNSVVPRTKDKSESFYRRLLIVPMNKSFTGVERPYIKHDYLGRQDVLQHVLRRSLETSHTELSIPPVCQTALDEYRGGNNTFEQFWETFADEFVWDLLPFRFLYDLYVAWFRKVNPGGQLERHNLLVSSLKVQLAKSEVWEHKGTTDVRPLAHMARPEPLINEYGLTDWVNTTYTGTDVDKRCFPFPLKVNYKGVRRRASHSDAQARSVAATG